MDKPLVKPDKNDIIIEGYTPLEDKTCLYSLTVPWSTGGVLSCDGGEFMLITAQHPNCNVWDRKTLNANKSPKG